MALSLRRSASLVLALAVVAAGAFWVMTRPRPVSAEDYANPGEPNLKNGETVFWTAGCESCHAAKGAKGKDKLVLSGGLALNTPFGTFYPPNISPDKKAGIGSWTLADFASALKRGVGKNGEHLYPAFPYTSYTHMSDTDLRDLFFFLRTLPKSSHVVPPHKLSFPFNIRMALGGWKFLFFSQKPRVTLENASAQVKRGQYLVEGPGHCGECHTPRNMLGGFDTDKWLAGGPNPEGDGVIPDITPGSKDIGSWSTEDIVNYLQTGFTPDFDTAGGSMVDVQKNLAHLSKEELGAIASYLKAIHAR